jgi:hypothetical protein
LSRFPLYRSSIKEAVRIFRPVLRGLKIRSEAGHPIVYFAQFKELSNLNLDECSVQVLVADIGPSGMFASKYTEKKLLRAYIILSRKLYNNQKRAMKELRKIAGVHEFVHFIAVVYVATAVSTADFRSRLLERLQHTVKKLPGANLLELYAELASKVKTEKLPDELTDSHFRLGYEGPTPDYELLFLHFMFSRELFEDYFNIEKQTEFKRFLADGDKGAAIQLLVTALGEATKDKDVPFQLAFNQLLDWVHVYVRDQSVSMSPRQGGFAEKTGNREK